MEWSQRARLSMLATFVGNLTAWLLPTFTCKQAKRMVTMDQIELERHIRRHPNAHNMYIYAIYMYNCICACPY